MLQAYTDLISCMLEDRVNGAATIMILWAAFEAFRTYYVWRDPDNSSHVAIEEVLGLLDERHEARWHRNIEFVILAFVVTLQGALWLTENQNLLLARWFAHAVCIASLLLASSARKHAYDRIEAAHEHALEHLDQATALKQARSAGTDEPCD